MSEERAVREAANRLALILTTTPSLEVGEAIVRTLVEEQLIACGNLLPGAVSIYRWEGEVVKEEEILVLIKADTAAIDPVFERLAELHPYSVPELIELSSASVSKAYRRWVVESTKVPA